MIVDNFYVNCIRTLPFETDAPLVILADAVLPFAVFLKRFEPVSRQARQIAQAGGRIKHQQLSPRRLLNARQARARQVVEDSFGVRAAKAFDHDTFNIIRDTYTNQAALMSAGELSNELSNETGEKVTPGLQSKLLNETP